MTYGMEAVLGYQASKSTKLKAGYSLFQQINTKLGKSILVSEEAPQDQLFIQIFSDISAAVRWDSSAYYVGELKKFAIPAYIRLDTQLTWQASNHVKWFIGGQNLQDNSHPEFDHVSFSNASNIERNVFVKVELNAL